MLNGAGECTGFLSVQEWGLLETPIFLTSTMQVGRVYDAACELLDRGGPAIGVEDVVIPVVAECDDSFLNDARRCRSSRDDVARGAAGGRGVGGHRAAAGRGRGRRRHRHDLPRLEGRHRHGVAAVPRGHTVGVLVLTNFGERDRLTRRRRPRRPLLRAGRSRPRGAGRLVHRRRRHRRAARQRRLPAAGPPGRARPGPHRLAAHHASGEIFLAFADGCAPRDGRRRASADGDLDPFFAGGRRGDRGGRAERALERGAHRGPRGQGRGGAAARRRARAARVPPPAWLGNRGGRTGLENSSIVELAAPATANSTTTPNPTASEHGRDPSDPL